jgi:uncharacterized protein YndB with AHSA1/START domain
MLWTSVSVIVLLAAAILVLAATRPPAFVVKRSIIIAAPPERIFALIADFHCWALWSPYEKLDPAMKKTFAGPPSGVGAIYEWSGAGKAGAGRMEIVDAPPPSKVSIKLDFSKPFEAHNIAEFTLTPRGGATEATWSMSGANPFMFKLMSLVLNMDKMIGKDFETGLAQLKAIAEK